MNRAHDQQCLLSRKLQDTSGQFVRLKFPSPLKFSHWWIDFDVRGSIFHSVRIRQCTRLTDLNSDYETTRALLAMGPQLLNPAQVTRTTPELTTPSPNFHSKPTGGRLSPDTFDVHQLLYTMGLQWL
ncbi:uncharacterized protein TNCV_3253371 [Trichonephila clavipes]|nr:uncharacterized protein TNCV_3253371 [Trichonephila clavipes]